MTLAPIQAPELRGLRHGFFTREGGVSTGIWSGLNAGRGSGDDPSDVAENRARIETAMGGGVLMTCHQVHSATAVTVTEPFADTPPRADALVTATPGLVLGALSADCAPVLFADREAGVIGAAHAGWKGALDGVIGATVDAMRALGAREIRAAVGPAISQRNYEVGPEFMERFLDEDPDTARFFAGGQGDRVQFDLPGFVLWRLRAEGVEAGWTGHCTYADEGRFYSWRRACHRGETDYGRLCAAIAL